MVRPGAIVIGSASIAGAIFSSVLLVEYRLLRERVRDEHRRKVRWAKKARIITDQIARECRDIDGMNPDQWSRLSEGRDTHAIFDRIQELKDLLSEAPEDIDNNTEYFMRDIWVKFEMSGIGTDNMNLDLIRNDTMSQAEKATERLEKYENKVKNQSFLEKFRGKPIDGHPVEDEEGAN